MASAATRRRAVVDMFRERLRLKTSLFLALALSPMLVLMPLAIVGQQRHQLEDEAARHVTQVAELIVKSTRYAMLLNQREIAEKIIQDIGRQEGIERVRVLNKDGTIVYSKRNSDTGYSVEQSEQPCVGCHEGRQPLARVPEEQRWRIYHDDAGRRLLSAMEPIRNEPSCSDASCHEHRPGQSVLGVVDIAYSLGEIDRELGRHAVLMYLISGGGVLLAALAIGLLLRPLVFVPLSDIETGARRIADGELDYRIPVRSADEFGRVADSFNQMGGRLKAAMLGLQDLVQQLEQKVEQRTRALRSAEAEVAQGEKLASLGLLASGIAHELNNPLTGVLTFTTLLRRKMPEGSVDAEDLDLVIRETKRCAGIIRRLLDFAREKVPSQGDVALNPLVEEVVRLVDLPATLHRIEIENRLDPALPPVWGDADLLKQVLLNIVVNATQAIEGEGRVVIETRRLEGETPRVEVAVSDTGCGIPQANLQRIFDPFFTTKGVGKGTGLGLSVSYGIVKAHGGSIEVESVVGEGSTFRVRLPASAHVEAGPSPTAGGAATSRAPDANPAPEGPHESGRVQP